MTRSLNRASGWASKPRWIQLPPGNATPRACRSPKTPSSDDVYTPVTGVFFYYQNRAYLLRPRSWSIVRVCIRSSISRNTCGNSRSMRSYRPSFRSLDACSRACSRVICLARCSAACSANHALRSASSFSRCICRTAL